MNASVKHGMSGDIPIHIFVPSDRTCTKKPYANTRNNIGLKLAAIC